MPLEITEELIARQPPEAQTIFSLLLSNVVQQDRRIAGFEAEVRRLRKTPQNSALRGASARRTEAEEERPLETEAGQPAGRQKCQQPLVPADDCDEVIPLEPDICRRCGTPLEGGDPDPLRHQVWELSKLRRLITEYQRHGLECPGCGESPCVPLPPGVPTGQPGPRLVAFTRLLMAYFRQCRRRTALVLETVFGVPCSTGLTVKQETLLTQALRPAHEELAVALPQQSHFSADETPTKEAAAKAWLWTVGTDRFTVYAQRPSRRGEVAGELLTCDFRCVVSCHRAKI